MDNWRNIINDLESQVTEFEEETRKFIAEVAIEKRQLHALTEERDSLKSVLQQTIPRLQREVASYYELPEHVDVLSELERMKESALEEFKNAESAVNAAKEEKVHLQKQLSDLKQRYTDKREHLRVLKETLHELQESDRMCSARLTSKFMNTKVRQTGDPPTITYITSYTMSDGEIGKLVISTENGNESEAQIRERFWSKISSLYKE